MIKRLFASVVLVTFLSVFSVSSQDEPITIMASHSILGDVVQEVVGDVADVGVTMGVGVDPHGFQPVPSDLTALADADIVFINGAFFEEGLLEAIENATTDNIIEVSACIEMLPFDDQHHHDEDHDDDHSEDHDDDHSDDHDDDHSEEHDDHNASMMGIDLDFEEICSQYDEALSSRTAQPSALDTSLGKLYTADCDAGCDPHVWMNPYNVMLWTLLVRDQLSVIDPDNADIYRTNADDFLAEIDILSSEVINPTIESLPVENRILITNHDSFGYFAETYNFEIVQTVLGGSTLGEPSTSEIVDLINLIRERGVEVIFSETTVSDDIVRQIATETGAEIYALYTGSLSDVDEPASTYIDYMTYNITTIVTALSDNDD